MARPPGRGAARLGRPLYAALSYDGRVGLTPASRHDETVIAAVNRHQRPTRVLVRRSAPHAARPAPEAFRGAGFAVVEGRSDWNFGPSDRDIQMAMLAGWAEAAGEMGVRPSRLRMACRTPRPCGGGPLAPCGSVTWIFSPPDGAALSRKVAVEQHLVAEHMGVVGAASLPRNARSGRGRGSSGRRRE